MLNCLKLAYESSISFFLSFLAGELESTSTKAARGKDMENSSTPVSIFSFRPMVSLLNDNLASHPFHG